jgi:hypothetical protein
MPGAHDLLNRVNFIMDHGMSQPRINPLIDLRIHSTEHFARFVHSFERNPGIGVAAPEEVGHAGERSWIVARHEVSDAARSSLKDLEAALGPQT